LYDQKINRSYAELAAHYAHPDQQQGTPESALVPANVCQVAA
jgi:DnaJ-class molecular chaperone